MRKDITIAAETRTTRGKNEARRQRVEHQRRRIFILEPVATHLFVTSATKQVRI